MIKHRVPITIIDISAIVNHNYSNTILKMNDDNGGMTVKLFHVNVEKVFCSVETQTDPMVDLPLSEDSVAVCDSCRKRFFKSSSLIDIAVTGVPLRGSSTAQVNASPLASTVSMHAAMEETALSRKNITFATLPRGGYNSGHGDVIAGDVSHNVEINHGMDMDKDSSHIDTVTITQSLSAASETLMLPDKDIKDSSSSKSDKKAKVVKPRKLTSKRTAVSENTAGTIREGERNVDVGEGMEGSSSGSGNGYVGDKGSGGGKEEDAR